MASSWIFFSKIPLQENIQFSTSACVIGAVVAVFTFTCSVIIGVLTHLFPKFFAELKSMNDEFVFPLLKCLNTLDILFLSLLSGFAEEVLFRGAAQSQFGPYAASMLFGVIHDPTLKRKSYVILTACAGFVFAALYKVTGNLWAPITAHALHNLLTMLLAKVVYSKTGKALI